MRGLAEPGHQEQQPGRCRCPLGAAPGIRNSGAGTNLAAPAHSQAPNSGSAGGRILPAAGSGPGTRRALGVLEEEEGVGSLRAALRGSGSASARSRSLPEPLGVPRSCQRGAGVRQKSHPCPVPVPTVPIVPIVPTVPSVPSVPSAGAARWQCRDELGALSSRPRRPRGDVPNVPNVPATTPSTRRSQPPAAGRGSAPHACHSTEGAPHGTATSPVPPASCCPHPQRAPLLLVPRDRDAAGDAWGAASPPVPETPRPPPVLSRAGSSLAPNKFPSFLPSTRGTRLRG